MGCARFRNRAVDLSWSVFSAPDTVAAARAGRGVGDFRHAPDARGWRVLVLRLELVNSVGNYWMGIFLRNGRFPRL